MPTPDTTTRGVFLSYAREDTAAARRMADALRAFGMEVWFDQSELHGGDAWDAKIRKQIKECALFVPIISEQTEARAEGYFRREWKLAIDRTQDMAGGRAFLVPVVIDGTPEDGATVPEEFTRVQWTRLANGEPTPEFVSQIKRLLETPKKPTLKPGLPRPPTLPPEFKQAAKAKAAAEAAPAKPTTAIPGWLIGVIATVVVGAGVAFLLTRKPAPPAAPPVAVESKPAQAAPAFSAPVPARADAKSIAVLPFANMSAEKENEFLADGIHEDVLTSLAKIRDLKVISRTSVLAYRDTASRNLKKIAADLGVAVVLEGSVRRSGNKVRVTAQLIDARTDEHLWAENYDGDTSDVFALQAKLAQQIAAALKATLTPGERSLIERRPTQDALAYEFYQRAKLLKQGLSATAVRAEYDAMLALYEQALARDPNLALAHGDLVFVHGVMYWFGAVDPSPERRARAAAALAEIQRLMPGAPETRVAQGAFAYLCENDWPKALAEFQAAAPNLPNDDQLQYLIAITYRRLGRWQDTLNHLERAIALNPHDRRQGTSYIETLFALRRYALLPPLAPRFLELFPNDPNLLSWFAEAQFAMDGDRSTWLAKMAAIPPLPGDSHGLTKAYNDAVRAGDLATADRTLADPRQEWYTGAGAVASQPASLLRAELAALRGDREAARKFGEAALAAFASRRWSPRQELVIRVGLGRARLCMGAEGAVGELELAIKQVVRQDKFLNVSGIDAVRALAATGHNEEALTMLRWVVADPANFIPAELRNNPYFAKLKNDPRFEEILKSAKPL